MFPIFLSPHQLALNCITHLVLVTDPIFKVSALGKCRINMVVTATEPTNPDDVDELFLTE